MALDDQAAQQLQSHGPYSCVIEATGAQGALDLATELVAVRGRLVVAGYHQDGPRQVNMQQWNWKGVDVICAHERDPQVYLQGMQRAVQAVLAGVLRPQPLLTHAFSLTDINTAFETACERPEGFLKAVILFDNSHFTTMEKDHGSAAGSFS